MLPFIAHLKNATVQIGFCSYQVGSYQENFIIKMLFYLLVKMMCTLKSVAKQQMIAKPILKLLAIFIYKYMQGISLEAFHK